MKIDLTYLVLSIFIPLSVMAGDLEDNLNKEFNISLPDSSISSPASTLISDSPASISFIDDNTELLLTFKEARHLWFFGNKEQRKHARSSFSNSIQNKESWNYIDMSRVSFLIPYLLRSNEEEDKKVAFNYLGMIWSDKNYKDSASFLKRNR